MAKITCIAGTHNRLNTLKKMLESARKSAGDISVDFVIVDCGSIDGTLEHLREQTDVKLIERGKREGGRFAFNLCAKNATGDYLVVLNDDIEVVGDTLKLAYEHLEKNPDVGQVAFKNTGDLKVAYDYLNGVLYGQCCMTRRWLGELAGWWGSGYWTYAGDTQMGLRIWELGYKVVPLDGCAIYDYLTPDDLRQSSSVNREQDQKLFHARWKNRISKDSIKPFNPRLARVGDLGLAGKLKSVRLKITPKGAKERTGIVDGLKKLGKAKQLNQSKLCEEMGFGPFQNYLLEYFKTEKPDLIMLQSHGPEHVAIETVLKIKKALPETVIVNFNEDIRVPIPQWNIDMAKACDLTLVESPDMFKYYKGAPVSFLHNTYEKEFIVKYRKNDIEKGIFTGSYYPKSGFPDARLRHECVFMLREEMDVFGSGWGFETIDTGEDRKRTASLYGKYQWGLSVSNFNDLFGYTSDRLHFMLASGLTTVVKYFPGMKEQGFEDKVNCVIFDSVAELRDAIEYAKEHPEIGEAGREFVLEKHSPASRMIELMYLLKVNAGNGLCGAAEYIASGFRDNPANKHAEVYGERVAETYTPEVQFGKVLVRYLGKNFGLTPYHGVGTGVKYYFSTNDSLKYVDERDVKTFQGKRSKKEFEVING